MSAASIETTLGPWASELRAAKARLRPLLTRARVAASAGPFLDGLLGPERRETGWMRAEAAGDPGPWRQQAILGRGRWGRMRRATACATTRWRRWPTPMPPLSFAEPGWWTRPGS